MTSEYWQAIPLALQQGYRADPETGIIWGKSGKQLSVRRYGNQDYPTIRLHVHGLPRSAYSVSAHKFMAFVLWGWAAFQPGIEVRHLNGDTSDIRRTNLCLGTVSQNQLDKSPEARSNAARAARKAQGHVPRNARLTEEQARSILTELRSNTTETGRVRRGVVKRLAEQYGVTPSAICVIGKGKSWSALHS